MDIARHGMQEIVWQKPCMTNVNGQVYQYKRGGGVGGKLLHAIRNRYTKSKITLERLK